MDQTFVIIFTAVSFIIYGYSSFVSRRMKSEFIRWEFGNHRKTVGSLQILGGLGLLLGLKYNILLSKNDNYPVIFDMNHDSLKHTLLEES